MVACRCVVLTSRPWHLEIYHSLGKDDESVSIAPLLPLREALYVQAVALLNHRAYRDFDLKFDRLSGAFASARLNDHNISPCGRV